MKPGIYDNISNEEYHAGDGISSSGIIMLLDCPAKFHYQYVLVNREPPTEAMQIGTAFHTLILEPEKFDDQVMVNDFSRNSNKFKELRAENAGKIIIKQKDMDILNGMHKAVMGHSEAKLLLKAKGHAERSMYWEDEETGILCKCRPDKESEMGPISLMPDVKTTVSANPDDYMKSLDKYNSHISAAMYLEGAAICGVPRKEFIHIAVEKKPPYIVETYYINQDTLEIGSREFHMVLRKLKEYKKTNVWPGYTDGKIKSIGLSDWAIQRREWRLDDE